MPVTLERIDSVAIITIDDGKANALSRTVLGAISTHLDDIDAASPDTSAVILAGRTGMFSGGFDLEVMRGGDVDAIVDLVTTGAELILRLYQSGRPIVAACTGHAVAAGALLLLGSHVRVGADGPYRIGLIETAIGMVLPQWAIDIAALRLNPTAFQQATIEAKIFSPAEAVQAGFLDRVAPADSLMEAALEEAARLSKLDAGAYAGTAAKVRGPAIAQLASVIAADRASVGTRKTDLVPPASG